jgi:peroxiredoxin
VVITKDKFLSKLITGNYIPVEMQSDSTSIYKLYKIPNGTDEFISNTIKPQAQGEYRFLKMQGKAFPEFEAETLKGKKINNAYFNGKTTLIKTWFVSCKPCIKEMPELNKLVDQYQNENIQFLSLALDDTDALNKFLETTEFKYEVLPLQEKLIENQLKLWGYPTHLVINSSGAIEKVFDKSEELMAYINKNEIVDKTQIHNNVPPPPPGGVEFENETDTD